MKNPWKKISSKTVYKNPWIKVREDVVVRPDGRRGIYGVIENGPSVFIVPLTEKQETYLVGQFRYTTGVFSWEVPGGGSDGRSLLRAAKRELAEETGLTARRWSHVGRFQVFNGFCNEWGHIYIARDIKSTDTSKQGDEGISKMKKVLLKNALKMVRSGEITDSASIVALTRVAMELML